jgi:hypothetical protein
MNINMEVNFYLKYILICEILQQNTLLNSLCSAVEFETVGLYLK